MSRHYLQGYLGGNPSGICQPPGGLPAHPTPPAQHGLPGALDGHQEGTMLSACGLVLLEECFIG